jgi:MerR family mercuric resistance operon transcriptional regulator
MRIGELATKAGVKTSTIRFYEREGLLERPPRTPGGYRSYSDSTVKRVRFLRRAQALGFTLSELEAFLSFSSGRSVPRSQVEKVGKQKLGEIQARIDDLTRVRQALLKLMRQPCIDPKAECPLIAALGDLPE